MPCQWVLGILIDPRHGEPFNEDGTPINRWVSAFGLGDHSRMQGVLVDNVCIRSYIKAAMTTDSL